MLFPSLSLFIDLYMIGASRGAAPIWALLTIDFRFLSSLKASRIGLLLHLALILNL